MGGTIKVSSEYNKFTEFKVCIPEHQDTEIIPQLETNWDSLSI